MKNTPEALINWILRIAVFASLLSMSSVAIAQTTVIYDLENVWLLPDISHPRNPAQPMTGSFEWTYETGDFENGSGQFTELEIPWYDMGIENLNITIELTSIEFSLNGKYHDRGVDLTLFLLEPLSPNLPATIDTARSIFEIQYGISYKGHAVSGSVVPRIDRYLAELIDFGVTTGVLLNGGLSDLLVSDDSYINTRSGFGETVVDLHNMEMFVVAEAPGFSPATIDLLIESSIEEPAGLVQIRMKNYNTNNFDIVGSYAIGNADGIEVISGLDASKYYNNNDGRMRIKIKHLVFVPFLAFTFESFIDKVEIVVE